MDWCPTKVAYPASPHVDVRAPFKLISMPKERRFRRPKTEQERDNEYLDALAAKKRAEAEALAEISQLSWEESMYEGSVVTNNEASFAPEGSDSGVSWVERNPIRPTDKKTKKKFRKPVTNEAMLRATFDSSSYDAHRKAKPLDLNPIVIDRLSKVNIFGNSFLGQRGYKSRSVQSNVAEHLRPHAR